MFSFSALIFTKYKSTDYVNKHNSIVIVIHNFFGQKELGLKAVKYLGEQCAVEKMYEDS